MTLAIDSRAYTHDYIPKVIDGSLGYQSPVNKVTDSGFYMAGELPAGANKSKRRTVDQAETKLSNHKWLGKVSEPIAGNVLYTTSSDAILAAFFLKFQKWWYPKSMTVSKTRITIDFLQDPQGITSSKVKNFVVTLMPVRKQLVTDYIKPPSRADWMVGQAVVLREPIMVDVTEMTSWDTDRICNGRQLCLTYRDRSIYMRF